MISLSELEKLKQSFYMDSALDAAKNLLGKYLIKSTPEGYIGGMIVETECYMGPQDDAAHSYNLKKTKRNEAMYEKGGTAYVYQIYGMYYCLNVVTDKKDKPQAVLIRALEPVFGVDIMKENRDMNVDNLTNGPAKLCKALGINLNYNKQSLLGDELFIAESKAQNAQFEIEATKRINIDYAKNYRDKLWRFIIKNNRFVSR